MRKAEEGGKMNELLTVHNKEVKNARMNRHYPPDDDEWKDCEETSQQHVHPSTPPKVHGPPAADSAAGSAENKAPPGALWPEAYAQQGAWKVPPSAPPPTLQQTGVNSGIRDAREYYKKWQDRPYKGGPNSVSKNHISFRCQKNEPKTSPLYLLVLIMTIFPFLVC